MGISYEKVNITPSIPLSKRGRSGHLIPSLCEREG